MIFRRPSLSCSRIERCPLPLDNQLFVTCYPVPSRFHLPFVLLQFLEKTEIQRQRLTHPSSSLGVVPLFIISVRVNQCRKRPPIYHQPRNEGSELFRCEDIDLEHCHRMGTNWFIPYPVYTQFWELASNAFPQLGRKFGLLLVSLEEVDVYIESRPNSIGDWIRKNIIRKALFLCWWVHE